MPALLSRPVAALALLALATGCGSSRTNGVGAAPPLLRAFHWSSARYPSTCFGGSAGVTVHHGVAHGPGGFLRMSVSAPTFGTVAGTPVAVVTYRCIGANAGPDTALVYTWSHGRRTLLATLLVGEDVYVHRVSVSSDGLRISGVGYRPGTPQCCPDLAVTYRFRWVGGRPVRVATSRSPLPSAPPSRAA